MEHAHRGYHKKCQQRLYCLVQLKREKVPEKEIVQFYCTYIKPVLEYAAPGIPSLSTTVFGR